MVFIEGFGVRRGTGRNLGFTRWCSLLGERMAWREADAGSRPLSERRPRAKVGVSNREDGGASIWGTKDQLTGLLMVWT